MQHLNPQVRTPITGFDLTPELVAEVMEEARSDTAAWLTQLGY